MQVQENHNQVTSAGEDRGLILPNQMKGEDNKALGLGYLVEEDKLYVLTAINFSRKKRKMRVGQDLLEEEVRGKTPDPLTRRELLSQIAGLYDPIGLVTPLKQKGAILVRKAFQEAGSGKSSRETWDNPLSAGLREEAVKVFEEYVQLSQITFDRSLTPPSWIGKPLGITFSDGSDKSFGAVVYLRWETEEGIQIRLVESKAKLTPLNQKGDPVKAEICGAVFAARLRRHIEKHGRMEIGQWFHLLDSQTVLGAIQRDSYGYQTFFANRVGEIQRSGSVEDWWWIPGDLNISDIITRGATPADLKEESEWQKGPSFLKMPVEEWPKKSAKEVAANAKEGINKIQRKTFTAALTRAQAKMKHPDGKEPVTLIKPSEGEKETRTRRISAGSVIGQLIDVRKFSSLDKLVRVVAWVLRAAKEWKRRTMNPTSHGSKWEVMPSKEERELRTKNCALCWRM